MPNDMWTVVAHAGLSGATLGQAGGNPSNQSLGGSAGPTASGTVGVPSAPAGPGGPAATPPQTLNYQILLLPLLAFAFIIFTTWRQSKNEKKKRAELIDALAKGDTVQTLGGEIGVVFDIRDQEVVLKFEEGKVRYVKSAIAAIIKPSRAKDGANAAIEAKDAKEAAKA